MTESVDPRAPAAPLARCCRTHPDWPTLSQHLLAEFPDLDVREIVREVARAKAAVATASLDGMEALVTGELIARHQLMLLSGRLGDIARLDPETHIRSRSLRAV